MRACSSPLCLCWRATVIAILYISSHLLSFNAWHGELLPLCDSYRRISLCSAGFFTDAKSILHSQYVRRPRPEELTAELFSGKYYNISAISALGYQASLHLPSEVW